MPHSFVYLILHVVFSTRNRAPDLNADLSARLFPYMGGIVKTLRGVPFIVNGPADHVHLLLSLPAGVSIAEMMRVVKTNSSRWVHVSGSRLEEVRNYIARQQEHHRKVSFQEEFLSLLKKHGLEYDPNEVWG